MTHRHELRESPVRGDTPAGFGGRAGETYREQSRQRAPVRPYSTYGDLKDHREHVYRTLRQLNHDVIAMEDYVAAPQQVP
jgi:hypothetical protein